MTRAVREARLPIGEAPPEGGVRMLDVGGVRVGLFRVGDELHALADRCPHRGAPLCSGRIVRPISYDDGELSVGSQRVLRCPWHKWEFDIATGRCLVDERLRVRRYEVRADGVEIVVTLAHPAASRPTARR